MHVVKPKIYLIAATETFDLRPMLEHLGAPDWHSVDCASGGERLIEVAGRACYKSFAPGLNPNVTKVREGNREYIANILKQKHGSVLEHSSVTFAMLDVSRIFTHEVVRHRAGCAFSQESMRYVRMDDIGMFTPLIIKLEGLEEVYKNAAKAAEEAYEALVVMSGIEDEKDFHKKKVLTSAFRRIAPGGHSTNIIMTANHRAWRHMIELRTSEGAEEEIRLVFQDVAAQMFLNFPSIYQDIKTDNPDGSVTFTNSKV